MKEFKLLFTGPMGAGKTTAIASISEIAPVMTDVANTDRTHSKLLTTVGLDFGHFTLDTGDRIRLFGTPGQARFDFLWKILVTNALGIVILANNAADDPIGDLRVYLDGFAASLDAMPCVIGVGHTDTHASPTLDEYVDEVAQRRWVIPIVEVDVRARADVALLIDILLTQIETRDTRGLA